MPENTSPMDTTPAVHIAGGHLRNLTGKPYDTRLRDLFRDDVADIIADWHRVNLGYGRDIPDPGTGHGTNNPYVDDVLAIPVTGVIAESLADLGVGIPTRQECREWAVADLAEGGDGIDPEVELDRVRLTVDPDIYAATTGNAEKRINGVPESVYNTLEPDAQAKVREGLVIAAPQSPTAVARWLVRNRFTVRKRIPHKDSRRRATAPMRTAVRVDEVWYEYARPAAGGPPRWTARGVRTWMRAQLRSELSGFWYIKTNRADGANVYSLKWWNPDTRTLGMVEDALADLLDAGTGTAARELPDAYGRRINAYPQPGTWVLCRNGVLDVTTGTVRTASPLWFSMTRIDADYDHAIQPYAEGDWLRVLWSQWSNDPDAITCLQMWFGYVLSGRTDLQKWMYVYGLPGSSKSVIAAVLEALIGNYVELGLDALNDNWGLAAAYTDGATLAVMSDTRFGTRDSSLAVSRLLAVTGDDPVEVKRKYRDTVTARLPIRFHGTGNDLPKLADHTGALSARMLLLETTRGFRGTDDDDPGLKKRIIAHELGAVLRWAVDGLALLNAANGRFTRSNRADEMAEELEGELSNVKRFLSEAATEYGELGTGYRRSNDGDFVNLRDLYRVFGAWATEVKSGERMSQKAFATALKHAPGVRVGQKRMPDDQPGKWMVVWGLKRVSVKVDVRGQFGIMHPATVSTDPETERDPLSRN